jgi:phospholipase A2-like protein
MILIRHRRTLALAATTFLIALTHGDAAARPFIPNGCGTPSTSWVPEYRFTPACNRHDECYAAGAATRATCDARFLVDMRQICDTTTRRLTCRTIAEIYYDAVRLLGRPAFTSDRKRYGVAATADVPPRKSADCSGCVTLWNRP